MSPTQPAARARPAPWLLLMYHLPAGAASQRVSVWRKLQKYGALAWKHSAYLLPNTPGNLEKFQWLLAEVRKVHGDGSILRVARIEGASQKEVVALFNSARAREYERIIHSLRAYSRGFDRRSKRRRLAALAPLRRLLGEIAAIDMFGCPLREEAEALLKEIESRDNAGAIGEALSTRSSRGYTGRVWMTRPRPQVDRVASAWLIKRFVDAKAKFVFSSDPRARPGVLRFDMFEGEFTHLGDNCTFETLVKRFRLQDRCLRVIAQIVHDADLEDDKFGRPEGRAIDLILKGWGKMDWPDEEILRRGFELFESLYLTLKS
ncbi:MAG: chromate resistance protein [Acidobacteria bacterium]|nr:chromate resistance protein [Acidobacteriota bacterium]